MKKSLSTAKKFLMLLALMSTILSGSVVVNADDLSQSTEGGESIEGVSLLTDEEFHQLVKSNYFVDDEQDFLNFRSSVVVRKYTTGGLGFNAEVFTGNDFSEEEMARADATVSIKFPDVVKLGQHTRLYNCHSYAWYNRSTSNGYLIYDYKYNNEDDNNLDAFINDTHTQTVSSNSLQIGDIVVYLNNDGDRLHSAVVTSINSDGEIWCTSKWGTMGLYLHEIEDVPEAYSADELSGTDFNFEYYRYTQGEHDFAETMSNIFVTDVSIHGVRCTYCPATWYYAHQNVYTKNNAANHRCLCRICGYTRLQAHEVDETTGKCIYCLYAGPFAVVTSMQAIEQLKQECSPTTQIE